MKQTTQISLASRSFILDNDAFALLDNYLASLEAYYQKEGGTGSEIIADIEARLAELFEGYPGGHRQVVSVNQVQEAIQTLGKIEDFDFQGQQKIKTVEGALNRNESRKLFRNPDDAYLGGVCGGLAAWFNNNAMLFRILFFLLSLFHCFGILLYLVMWIITPRARTTAQKLQMRGEPVTAENIRRFVTDEFEKVSATADGFARKAGYLNTGNTVESYPYYLGRSIQLC